MIVLKFGGSSVGSTQNIHNVKEILKAQDMPFIAVFSAISGVTDQLKALAFSSLEGVQKELIFKLREQHVNLVHSLIDIQLQPEVFIEVQKLFNELEELTNSIYVIQELSDKTLAYILSYGERLSLVILAKYFKQEELDINVLESDKLIRANHSYLESEVDFDETKHLISECVESKNYIASGFIAGNAMENIVLLGRGGSDYSAAIYAYAIEAERLEIWSDVNGMLNANPNMVSQAETISQMSYKEACELAYFGAKVIFPPTIHPVMLKKIPIFLKNTLNPEDKGTIIQGDSKESESGLKGISSLSNISLITVSGLAGNRGALRSIFPILEQAGVNVTLVSQSGSEQSVCFGVKGEDSIKAVNALRKHFEYSNFKNLINPIEIRNQLSLIAIVGDNMKNRVGLSGRVFSVLGENGINIIAIAQGASERNISLVVAQKDETKALNVVHEKFFGKAVKRVHLAIVGNGNVGEQFLNIIHKQNEHLLNANQIELKVIALANSKKMQVDPNGLSLKQQLDHNHIGEAYCSFDQFKESVVNLNLRNTIFIDNTASEMVSKYYADFLDQSISVVTCNKIAQSQDQDSYQYLRFIANKRNSSFQYETAVGAALPVIKTIKDMRLGGDQIHKIEAVLSGSLNFIFNKYDGSISFAEVVQQAKEEGYTEPDPRIDLSGKDVMRKILILARESGYKIEPHEIVFKRFLPESCRDTEDVNSFMENLRLEEEYFKKRYKEAKQAGEKLKVIAKMDQGKLTIGLETVSAKSEFYRLEGKDNVVVLYSDRYHQEPLMIKGAGAGSMITASGVFSDLMYIINR